MHQTRNAGRVNCILLRTAGGKGGGGGHSFAASLSRISVDRASLSGRGTH